MEFNGWNNFEDLARACGYSNNNNNNNNNNNGDANNKSKNNTTNNFSNSGCGDIPNGFQSLNPELFTIIGEVLGNIIAGSIPFNVQNALGNWLQLVGQAIETYNAQQQYFQGGPGRYFNPKYYNVNNPFCSTTTTTNTQSTSSSNTKSSNKSNRKNVNSNDNIISTDNDIDKRIEALESRINQLTVEIENMRNAVQK